MVDVPLGTLIFRAGLLGEEQLEDALQEGMRTGKRLGEVLLERGWLNERDLGLMLAGQKGLPFVDVSISDVEPEALDALDEDDARRRVALPLFYEDGELVLAVGDPSNEVVLEGLRRAIEADFQLVVAPHSQLQQVIDEAYSRPAPAPAPREGVLFPDLVPPGKSEAPVAVRPEPAFEPEPEAEAQPDLGFAPALETDPEPEAEEKPFSGSTPTLLSRMLFPSVRHAVQETEGDAEQAEEEPVAEAPATAETPQLAEEPALEPAEAPAPAEEDFAELEVPAVPEMPIPSFEHQPAEAEPAAPQENAEPATTEQPAPEAQPAALAETPEPVAEQPAVETEAPAPEEAPEPAAEQAPEPAAEPTVAETEAQVPATEDAPEPAAEQALEPAAKQPAEEAHAPTHFVLVRLRDGESLRIGEYGSAAEASAQAAEAVAQISSATGNGTWPLFAARYLSPGMIVSVDLVEESPDA